MFPSRILWIAAVAATARLAGAPPVLAPLFQDHGVLQQGRAVPVWGRAAPGEHVKVAFAGQSVGTTAGADGKWIALLAPLASDAVGSDLVVAGTESVTVHDLLVGEVWLCSGERTMESPLNEPAAGARGDAATEVAQARHPLIRQFKVERRASPSPSDSAAGSWSVCSPETAGAFTAVGYFFARDLHDRLGVPVGIINCTWSATPLEAWMSPAALAAFPGFSNGHSSGGSAGAQDPWAPASLFNGMVHPLLPYALRGVLWSQGESNAGRAAAYSAQFPALIAAWRSHFGEDDLPFFWVQLATSSGPADGRDLAWAQLREAQSRALALPGTGQAVAIDLGAPGSSVPRDKREVARRLALIAKSRVYSLSVNCSGPVFAGAEAEGAAMRIRFAATGEGLTASAGPLQSFEVAGADRVFHRATASIQGDTVVARSAQVRQPVAVRYAWRNAPEANLYNGAGLPAAPFRSDDW